MCKSHLCKSKKVKEYIKSCLAEIKIMDILTQPPVIASVSVHLVTFA